jgi:RES domain-containing protein
MTVLTSDFANGQTYDSQILEALEHVESARWAGHVWRHMLGDIPPETVNTRGARWNPPGVAAIYTSTERDTALAEARYRFEVQPLQPSARRTLYEIKVELDSVLDLRTVGVLASVGISTETFASLSDRCALVGGSAAWLGHDGILVPSARADGTNLVIYPNNSAIEAVFDVVNVETLTSE